MHISIFGLGYVGTVSAACFAARGHQVVGVDVNRSKVDLLASGKAPIVEQDVEQLIAENVARKRLSATASTADAIAATDLSIVCVGTPSAPNGSIDTGALAAVCTEIGAALAGKSSRHTVVIRSTILPGTFRNVVVPALEESSGRRAGTDFAVATNPEFLREGTAVADFRNPPKTVVGADDAATADIVASLYEGLPGAVIRTTPEIAEVVKYVDNPWHALKVAFANEIGNICQAVGVDSHAVMDIFFHDTKLNISPAYLKPGFAFGGSCLPKDLRAITYLAQRLDLKIPVLQSINTSNMLQIERALDWILGLGKKDIAVLGVSFKAGTDDLRESPFIILVERLIGKGCRIRIFDHNIKLSMLTGANRDYINATIPHIASLMVDSAEAALADAGLVLITANVPEYVSALDRMTDHQHLLDFARVNAPQRLGARYHGINW
ncbi:MAG: UDP-glucose/GDP-mannose dehydrogenase family protein [Pseudorhodoplanes sp.]|nr:UDP-glucose/GDP-mannose dehydrogenase family protein [Pseudorhodoplanes sp.]